MFPVTERRKAAPPAAALFGMSELIAGVGNDVGAVIVNVTGVELVAELETETFTVPMEAISA